MNPSTFADKLPDVIILQEQEWQSRRARHEARVQVWIGPHLDRRFGGKKDPVIDFLFNYYSLRPAHLLRWTPGFGVVLAGAVAEEFLTEKFFVQFAEGVGVDVRKFPLRRLEGIAWALKLLRQTAGRPAQNACYGLHEWAMVYRTREVRHGEVPLRLDPEALAQFVESQKLVCTHFDAFRFFTPEAKPLNKQTLTREDQLDSDQPGCIHANMDLYKWAYKLLPWIPSELVADCFENAMAARTIDMRASPYDLRDQGYEPICIETEEGRDEYVRHQREITARAQPLRQRLAEFHEKILEEAVESPQKAGFAQGIWELQMDTDQTRMRSVAGRDAQGPPLDSSPDI